MPAANMRRYENQRLEVIRKLEEAKARKLTIVYLDEIVFSKTTFPKRDFSNRGMHRQVNQKDLYITYKAALAAISTKRGMEKLSVYDAAVNTKRFETFVKALHKKFYYRPFAIYMDQLNVHKSKKMQKVYKRLRILPIYNVAYSPELNPIETCFC